VEAREGLGISAQLHIREQSVKSLLVIPRASRNELGTATGFVAVHHSVGYLVTNWHVVSGRHPNDGEALHDSGAVPDCLAILHNVAGKPGEWRPSIEPLYDDEGDPLWFEHPQFGRRVDVIALPLTKLRGVQLYPYDPSNPGPSIVYGPSDPLTVIGFPFGITGGGCLGIWVQGTIATEPAIDFAELPCLLIDSRTRPGQSGSPVIAYRTGGYQTEEATLRLTGEAAERFVGVYSGRINKHSDLGFVWKVSAVLDILNGQQRGPLPTIGPPP
jgi:hypothetical protein